MSAAVLVLGSSGQLGGELLAASWPAGWQVIGRSHADLDITRRDDVMIAIETAERAGAGLVINAAAYTAVDKAESESDRAFATNRDGAAHVASACARARLPLVHLSTDYVFDGTKQKPYVETDAPNPINVYGSSKLAGERAVQNALAEHVNLRTSWVYSARGHNFVKTILRLATERDEVRVVNDQFGCPTSARDLAGAIAAIAERIVTTGAPWGTYHCAGHGRASWVDFANAVLASSRTLAHRRAVPIPTAQYPTAAQRPAESELDSSHFARTFGITLPSWRESVARVVSELEAP